MRSNDMQMIGKCGQTIKSQIYKSQNKNAAKSWSKIAAKSLPNRGQIVVKKFSENRQPNETVQYRYHTTY